ncbi:MAG: glycosyltransferase family 1 protein [Candidatus Shapirobacteria bacterium]|nr:glycosyltransferase family 1 protein [Candidatus Shapirobacteria bacterium]MDD5074054.1 glycosyltransferase family 1 protein [Candidatus Shapirobacteria bacterium]
MKKTIGIDARMQGAKHAGIGRYTANLIDHLSNLKEFNRFNWVLFVRKEDYQTVKKDYGKKFTCLEADFPHYSLTEQFLFPLTLYRSGCDLVHFPHFNVPVFYLKPFTVTIHDLIKHQSRGPQTTTRKPALYKIKFFFYQLVVSQAVKRAVKVFVPSRFVKNQIVDQYQINKKKVTVTYEGIDKKFLISSPPACPSGKRTERVGSQFSNKEKEKIIKKYQIKKPYLLYVGSVYPHKNINRLIEAVKIAKEKLPALSLVIVCSRNVFWQRLKKTIHSIKADKFVHLTGFVPDEDLALLYREATSFVFPSLMEGFGLPPLEAMASSCPVISSNAACLPEIYGQAALFFNPLNLGDMAEKIISMAGSRKLQNQYRIRGQKKVKEYSWEKMAKKTLEEYRQVIERKP